MKGDYAQGKGTFLKKRKLGKSGIEVSTLGLGYLEIGGRWTQLGVDIHFGKVSDAESIRAIQWALDQEINFFDTAANYGAGHSEQLLGKAIAGRRDELVLATKTSWRDKASALRLLEQSLQQFNTDYIDLWQFHNVSTFEAYNQLLSTGGAMEIAQEALKAGKIQHIGISTHSPDVARKAITFGHFETVMFPFNFVTQEPADDLVPLAREYDVGFLAMKPFAGGMLQDANLAIKYLLQFDNVVPVPGIEKNEEIEEIVEIVKGEWELTLQENQQIANLSAELDTLLCRRCGNCMPCPQGVRIQQLVNLPALLKLWSLDRLVNLKWVTDAVDGAKYCVECAGECEQKCPYHLPIRDMIADNLMLFERMVQSEPGLE